MAALSSSSIPQLDRPANLVHQEPMTRIMIIRHAEKPNERGAIHGVTEGGAHNRHALTVRGWQRAGALVRYFAPHGDASRDPLISRPHAIHASAATPRSPSLRSQNTVAPLADLLGIRVEIRHPEGDESGLAETVLAGPRPALIAWHHKRIPALVDTLTGGSVDRPARWPDARFDLVWVLDRDDPHGRWTFAQTTQCLLPRDRPDPVAY
jgi:hypothetical protein